MDPRKIEYPSFFQALRAEKLQLVVVVAGIWFFEWLGMTTNLTVFLGWLANPLLTTSHQLVMTAAWPYQILRTSHRAARRIQDLELKYAVSQAQLSDLAALQAENQALRALLESSTRASGSGVVAAPIVSLTDPAIAAGSEAGVKPGYLVTASGTLLGIVQATGPYQSEISLLSQRDGVLIVARTETGVEGLIKGDGRRVLLTEVPLDQPLEVGQKLVTVGQIGVTPQLFIGQIQSIKADPTAATQVAVVDQLVSFYQTVIVEVQSP